MPVGLTWIILVWKRKRFCRIINYHAKTSKQQCFLVLPFSFYICLIIKHHIQHLIITSEIGVLGKIMKIIKNFGGYLHSPYSKFLEHVDSLYTYIQKSTPTSTLLNMLVFHNLNCFQELAFMFTIEHQ